MHDKFSVFTASLLMAGALMAPAIALADNELNQPGRDTRSDGRGNHTREQAPRARSGGAVVSGNGINYHNGPVMHSVNAYYIWYGSWSSGSKSILTDFASHIGGSPYFNINTTYGDTVGNVPNAVTYGGETTVAGTKTALSDADIANIVATGLGQFGGTPDTNGVFFVLTAPGITETSGFLTQYCGWHSNGTFTNGTTNWDIKYAFVGDAAGPSLGSCAWQTSNSPNGDPGADAMVSVIAHELEESATDPDLNAWYDSNGAENADKCAWTFGTTYKPTNGSLANMKLGSRDFLIQQNWLNAGGGSCALSYTTSADFSVSVSPGSQTVAAGGTTQNYTLTATPLNGWAKTATWTVTPPAGVAASAVSGSGTFTLTASSGLSAGTYSIGISGTDGTNTHATTASLVVSKPTISISISPSSQSVTRPAYGSPAVTTTYTVTITPGAGFNSDVALTASGAVTGLSLSLSPATVKGGTGTSTLTATVTSSARRTTRTLTVTGTGGGVTKSGSASLSIQ